MDARLYQATKKITFAFALSFCLAAAGYADWDAKGVKVLKVLHSQRGATAITRVIYQVDVNLGASFTPGFSCAPTTTAIEPGIYTAAYWSSSTDNMNQTMVSQLLAAQAQGVSVDLYFDPAYQSGCNTDPAWGFGGLGYKLMGVAVNPE